MSKLQRVTPYYDMDYTGGGTEKADKLKPCSCGSVADVYVAIVFNGVPKWRTSCLDCHICTNILDTEQEAIQSWNRRVSDG